MMKPYYEQDGISIFHGDCRDVCPLLPKGCADLMVTDPPYGVNWQSGNRDEAFDVIAGDDDASVIPGLLTVAARLLKPCRHAYVFGRFDYKDTPFTAKAELIWDKGMVGLGDLSLPWGESHEPITFAMYVPSQANRKDGYGRLAARLRQGSVLRVQRHNSRGVNKHPTEKPTLLLRQLIESSSIIGETVLDPFMGSGSTLVAALQEGRKAIGIEIDERYCEIAAKRLAQGVLLTA